MKSKRTTQDWKNISYLKHGNPRQQKVYAILMETKILERLKDHAPIVVGTIPLGIDIPSSDLDVVCQLNNQDDIHDLVTKYYGHYDRFKITQMGERAYAYNFWFEGCEIEIYASAVPTERSNSYRHLLIGSRLLQLYGEEFRKKIIQLKEKGYHTEPAIAKLLNLQGEIYETIFAIEDYTDEELLNLK